MRPVERGECPTEEDGSKRTYSAYANARRDLIERMGQYCSYCNQKLPTSLAVEHVQPKSLVPSLELEWDNFLLGCTNCNSIKGNKEIRLDAFLWPDIHNTDIAFRYFPDGSVDVHPDLDDPIKRKAQNLLDLVGLQRQEDRPTASDRRWKNRKATFEKATTIISLYESAKDKGAEDEFIELLGFWASDNGFFSIWLQIFSDYPKVRRQIIDSFTGTARNAFNAETQPIPRTNEL